MWVDSIFIVLYSGFLVNQSINIRLLKHDKTQANNVKREKYE